MIRAFPIVTLLAMLGPVAAGLWGTLLPAFGHLPAAGIDGPSRDGIDGLMSWNGFWSASALSVTTGLLTATLSLAIATLIVAGWQGTRTFALLRRALSPLLSVPHAAAAFGLAFLIAPSGWLFRLVALGLGWERPPDLLIVADPWGLTLTAGLVAKEVPFLLLMTLAALPQANADRSLIVARSLGYHRITGWLKAVFPAIYAQIRLPVYVVLAFSMSVVDVAIILGPTTPPTLSVQIVRWIADPDLSRRTVAAAAALWQAGLVAAALLAWWGAERAIARWGRAWAAGGTRRAGDIALRPVGLGLAGLVSGAIFLGLAAMATWSVAALWRFPNLLPDALTWQTWQRQSGPLLGALGDTVLVAGAATAIALVLVIGCLEAEWRAGRPLTRRGLVLVYLPLLVPQTAFLPGLQTFLLQTGNGTGILPVIATHVVFVLPYVFLTLGDPWRAWDTRYATQGAALGAAPARVLVAIRLPMLLAPILTAAAIGIAVSVGQYLPTLLTGGGRVATLTTEAVALAAGGDRRTIAAFALAQTAAALLPFAAALAIPALVFRNRRGLHG